MPQSNSSVINPNFGRPIFSWQMSEYNQYERGTYWYLIMGVVCLGLIIYAVLTANFLFALIILLFAFIIVLREFYAPAKITFAITDSGIAVGEQFYPFKSLSKFYIIYEPPMSKFLYFNFKTLSPPLSIFLDEQNPITIREYLLEYMDEDLEKEDEHVTDTLNRLFKL